MNTNHFQITCYGKLSQIIVIGINCSLILGNSDCDDLSVKLDFGARCIASSPYTPFYQCLMIHSSEFDRSALTECNNLETRGVLYRF